GAVGVAVWTRGITPRAPPLFITRPAPELPMVYAVPGSVMASNVIVPTVTPVDCVTGMALVATPVNVAAAPAVSGMPLAGAQLLGASQAPPGGVFPRYCWTAARA